MSKVIVESNKKKKALIEQMGVHEFIRFEKTRPVMGDCGAFDYIDDYNPPFQTDEILEYYERLAVYRRLKGILKKVEFGAKIRRNIL